MKKYIYRKKKKEREEEQRHENYTRGETLDCTNQISQT